MIRIALGIMPSLLRSIVGSALESEEGFAVMPVSSLPRGDASAEIDVIVICGDRGPAGGIPLSLLTAANAPAIVAIEATGDEAAIIRVTTERSTIGAAADLCDAVRRAAQHRRAELH